MNVYVPTSIPRPSAPRRIRARSSSPVRPLLWVSGVLAGATVLFTLLLISARLVSQDAAALGAPAPEADPFYQQKLNATVVELPAQF